MITLPRGRHVDYQFCRNSRILPDFRSTGRSQRKLAIQAIGALEVHLKHGDVAPTLRRHRARGLMSGLVKPSLKMNRSETLDSLLQLGPHLLSLLGERDISDGLHRGDRVDSCHLDLARLQFLDDDVAGQHRSNLVF